MSTISSSEKHMVILQSATKEQFATPSFQNHPGEQTVSQATIWPILLPKHLTKPINGTAVDGM